MTENNTSSFFHTLSENFEGDIDTTEITLTKYSRDASLFEIKPLAVVFPKHTKDISSLVRWVSDNHAKYPTLSITPRAAGTDMSGAAIGSSIIMDVNRFMNKVLEVTPEHGVVQPGCFYRDFDKETQKINRFMPAYTASREINAVGGMVGNNSAGEKAIKYGKTENYIVALKVVLADGKEYVVKPLTNTELKEKLKNTDPSNTFETELYTKIYALITENNEAIQKAKPTVSKNSAGYYLWNVIDTETEKFDLCRLIVGSQGTLGIVTEITFKLVPTEKFSNILTVALPSLDHVSALIQEILPFKPDSLETYDDKSMTLAVKFFSDFFVHKGLWGGIKLWFQFLPELWMYIIGSAPKLVLIVEFAGETEKEVADNLNAVQDHIKHFNFKTHVAGSVAEASKFWSIRHESFNLLRKHTVGKNATCFIEDIIVNPEYLPDFLPKLKTLLDSYGFEYTIQGHLGNGNFHIFPLLDLTSPQSVEIVLGLSEKVYALVHEYHGSITAEHNDGIVRTPYLTEQFGEKVVDLFKQTKNIFDPKNIFNPGKKVGGTIEDIRKAILKHN